MNIKKRKYKSISDLLFYMHLLEDGMSFGHIHKKYGINEDRLKVLWARSKGECGTQDGDCVAKKSESLSQGKECPSKREWARAIEELRQEGHPLEYMLMRVKMARSVFYYHLARLNDVDGHADMRKRIKAIYDENYTVVQ